MNASNRSHRHNDVSRRRAASLETLETRRLLSASLSNGVLTLTGTEAADNFYLNAAPGGKLGVYESGKPNVFFTLTSVKKIVAKLGGGDDALFITAVVGTQPSSIDAGAGNDNITAGDGNDTITTGDGNDIVNAGGGNDSVDTGAGNDQLAGGNGNDTLTAGAGVDLLSGGAGDDLLDGGLGADKFNGNAGVDTVTYASRTNPVTVDISDAVGEAADDGEVGEKDFVFSDVENLTGGSGNDKLTGSTPGPVKPLGYTPNNKLVGNGGNDTLIGLDGNDNLDGGAGNDSIRGGVGNDTITGGVGADSLYGDDGNDLFNAEDGIKDTVDGGAGTDLFGRIRIGTTTTYEKNVDRTAEGDPVNDLISNMED
jgi:Ca2+-binding RTX toxin-like protein